MWNKVTKLETKLAKFIKSFSNLSKHPSSDTTNPSQQKKRGKKRKVEIQLGYNFHFYTPFIPEGLNKVRTFASKSKACGCSKDLIAESNKEIVQH